MILNVGQIDQYNAVSKYFHFGMVQRDIPIVGRQMREYSLPLPTLVWWEQPKLGRMDRMIEFSRKNCLVGDYTSLFRD